MNNAPQAPTGQPLRVKITREPFISWFTLTLDNQHSEELEPEETREWFRVRGANMDVVEQSLDYAWNFYKAEVWIKNPKVPTLMNPNIAPNI
jgi:hypothetical protein